MNEGTHTDEATAMDVEDDSFWRLASLFKRMFDVLHVGFDRLAHDVEVTLEEVSRLYIFLLKFYKLKLETVVDANGQLLLMVSLNI